LKSPVLPTGLFANQRGSWSPSLRSQSGNRYDRLHRRNLIERKAEALPLVISPAEGADAFDAQFVESHGSFGGCGFARAGAEEDDIAVARDLRVARGECVGREMHRTGQGVGLGEKLEGMAEIDDVDKFACIELRFEILRLETRLDQLAQNHAATIETPDKPSSDGEQNECA